MRISRWVQPLTLLALLPLVLPSWGCEDSQDGTPVGPTVVTIRYLRHDNPNYITADSQFFRQYMEEHPNVKIEDTTVPFNTLEAALLADLTRDQFFYDLLMVPPSRMCTFTRNLTDVPDDVVTLTQAQSTFFEAPLAGSTCEGKLKGLPVEYNLEYGGVVVNMDKWEAKFPDREPGWTDWRSLIADASALTEYDDAGQPRASGLDISPDWPMSVWSMLQAQILQRGGQFRDPATTSFKFNTPEGHASLEDMVSWVTKDKIMYTSLVPDRNTGVTERLAAGATGYGWSDPARPLSAMGYVGTWGLASTRVRVPPGSNWRYEYHALPPMVGTEHKFAQDSGWSFAVPRTSRHPEVAWDIARSLALSAENMRRWSGVTGALPALKANGTASVAAADPLLAEVQPLLEHGRWTGYIPVQVLTPVQTAVLSGYWAVVAGSKTVEQALMDMDLEVNALIELYRGR
jgi:ABC-type glycerol-3-phosphate transport system substrate-binding protein